MHALDSLTELMHKALLALWRNKVPSKIHIFGWRLLLKRLPIRDELIKRGY